MPTGNSFDYHFSRQKNGKIKAYWSKSVASGTLPDSREGAQLITMDRKLLLFGGRNKRQANDLYILNTDKWNWTKVFAKSPPKPRFGTSIVNFKNKVYVFGG